MKSKEKKYYEDKARVLKALAHPTRLWIAEKLRVRECCVCEFVQDAGVDFSTISKHLAVMKDGGIIVDRKEGKWVYYRLKVPCVLELVRYVDAVTGNMRQVSVENTHMEEGWCGLEK